MGFISLIMINDWSQSEQLGIKCKPDYSWCAYYDGHDNFIPLKEALARERLK